jgi:beta-glucosidase
MELIGFKRVEMDAGKEKRIKFTVSTDQLGFFNRDMNFIIEPGEMEIMVGGSSSDIQVTGSFQLTGEVRQILEKKYETTVSVD